MEELPAASGTAKQLLEGVAGLQEEQCVRDEELKQGQKHSLAQ